MNCANHPNAAVAAYCQNCGKPLCQECVRSVGGVVYCEQCLAARLGVPVGSQPVPGVMPPDGRPNPGLAAVLGFIPGVGAMYNGQFVKALAHVLIFAVLVSLSDQAGVFGVFVAAWVFYQVFDAYQTARARRDGLPLPNPFGLNDLGVRLGLTPAHATPHPGGYVPPAAYGAPATGPASGAATGSATGPSTGSAYGTPSGTGAAPFTGTAAENPAGAPYSAPFTATHAAPAYTAPPMKPPVVRRKEPIGAVVLIALGVLFLFHTLGIFRGEWVDRSWPLIIVGIGAWLLYSRTREHAGGVQ